jgi:hypothetical protein
MSNNEEVEKNEEQSEHRPINVPQLEYPRFNGSNQALIIDEGGKVCDTIIQTKNIEVKMKPYQQDG